MLKRDNTSVSRKAMYVAGCTASPFIATVTFRADAPYLDGTSVALHPGWPYLNYVNLLLLNHKVSS